MGFIIPIFPRSLCVYIGVNARAAWNGARHILHRIFSKSPNKQTNKKQTNSRALLVFDSLHLKANINTYKKTIAWSYNLGRYDTWKVPSRMMMIDELEQKQLRCLCGEKAARAQKCRKTIRHIPSTGSRVYRELKNWVITAESIFSHCFILFWATALHI